MNSKGMRTLLFGIATRLDPPKQVDGVELRLDHFEKIDLEALKAFISSCGMPVMLTVRRKDQGGVFKGDEQARLGLLESLCALQPAYMDLEYDVSIEFRKKLFENYPNILFLSSYHDFSQTPEDLDAILSKMNTPYAHIYKIACTAKSTLDALRMLEFVQAQSQKKKIIGISMGEDGQCTRILAPVVGNFLTYASIENGQSTAPGQMTAKEIQETYRFFQLNKETKVYSLVGDPVDKSLGNIIHNAVFEDAKINAVYVKLKVKSNEIPAFFAHLLKLPFQGLSITMPHKETIVPQLSQMSIDSQVIGACNTVQIKNGKTIGFNTDGIGALNAIEKYGLVFGRHILIIGAGGAAKSIIFEAAQRGAFVTVVNRTPDKAIDIAHSVKGRGGGFDLMPDVLKQGYDVIVNCIPESDIVDEKWILPEKIAMDIVYVPKDTPFLIKAAQKKCRLVYGYEMFVGQAVEQERLWFSEGIDFEKAYMIIEKKVLAALKTP
jgi:3-dehydroquinate dehydratase/shikimate dehydrogenase